MSSLCTAPYDSAGPNDARSAPADLERNYLVYRRMWKVVFSGLLRARLLPLRDRGRGRGTGRAMSSCPVASPSTTRLSSLRR